MIIEVLSNPQGPVVSSYEWPTTRQIHHGRQCAGCTGPRGPVRRSTATWLGCELQRSIGA